MEAPHQGLHNTLWASGQSVGDTFRLHLTPASDALAQTSASDG